ncbi:MAG: hypothetical protein A2381_00720 [Bdellovibrionales bacterium RIFOXYB1_FULL_37_110]|nr:MAG: hypothetical protein A2417_01575 [Bdellovibrionales bacterium RIFOXYC1_FULL_37_79]OFZ58742.1 MAG: hypothetical protein A2381_00720 [Bdellovibrionales bacterium RIFOXYB1_FULL_37_110]OFZ64741.1 MAG: hypothetical protein A2577_06720 [Bdellovibrionales bacterium RIFOXYD1_FULL_36_51]
MENRNAREIIRKLLEAGFDSHKKFKKMGKGIVIIPDHGGKDLETGIIREIEKQSGVKLLN